MIKKAILSLMLLAGTAAMASASDGTPADKNKRTSINFGVKGGFNSTMLFADHFTIGGVKVSNTQNNYKVGYFASFFLRANFKHHFLQPEVSYNVNRGSVSAPMQNKNADLLSDNALIKTKMVTFDVPLLYGYKFIDQDPYGMAFFVGPKIAWVWKKHTDIEYSGLHQQDINERLRRLHYSAVFGLAVNVSKIFCDFRYEIGANNISKGIDFNKESTAAPHDQRELVFKRRRNVFSFSLGVIF